MISAKLKQAIADNAKELAHKIMGVEIECPDGRNSDNLAVIICTYFDDDQANPHDGERDEYDTWEQWVIDRHDQFESEIAKVIEKAMEDLNA
jgi:hypothetical protein